MTAYHEAGHALVARMLPQRRPGAQSLDRRPRHDGRLHQGRAGRGSPVQNQEAVRGSSWPSSWPATSPRCMVFDEQSTGAANDIERATGMARRMVTEFGMSERSGRSLRQERRAGFPRPRDQRAAQLQRRSGLSDRPGDPAADRLGARAGKTVIIERISTGWKHRRVADAAKRRSRARRWRRCSIRRGRDAGSGRSTDRPPRSVRGSSGAGRGASRDWRPKRDTAAQRRPFAAATGELSDAGSGPDIEKERPEQCSGRSWSLGWRRGTRTPDLYSAIVALSQLSYAPASGRRQYTDNANMASTCDDGCQPRAA